MLRTGFVLVVAIAIATAFRLHQSKAVCNISISTLNPEPIVVSSTKYEFLYAAPNDYGIKVSEGETILISCPGGILTAGSGTYVTMPATCIDDKNFTIGGESVNFNQITCSQIPANTARYTGNNCDTGGREIEVGFMLSKKEFARQIIICFDDVNQNSLYAMFKITKSIEHYENHIPRPFFDQDDFYNVGATSVNKLYTQSTQRATINRLLGLPANSNKYIVHASNYYLSRGHLAAKADFVYAPQQNATFHYVNAAPQWQTFNAGNWEQTEFDVRNYAQSNSLDLEVYTGTYGVATLPHEITGEQIPLYLYVNKAGPNGLPVPELYWKAVYDPATHRAVVLIGLNNPYKRDVETSVICTDISSQLNWLHWIPGDLQRGYSYACTYPDFKAVVQHAPSLQVVDILS